MQLASQACTAAARARRMARRLQAQVAGAGCRRRLQAQVAGLPLPLDDAAVEDTRCGRGRGGGRGGGRGRGNAPAAAAEPEPEADTRPKLDEPRKISGMGPTRNQLKNKKRAQKRAKQRQEDEALDFLTSSAKGPGGIYMPRN